MSPSASTPAKPPTSQVCPTAPPSPDVDIGVINGNYAIQAGLHASDALAIEDKDSIAATTYANILCVKEGNEQNKAIADLLDSLHSEAVRTYINDTYDGAVVPTF